MNHTIETQFTLKVILKQNSFKLNENEIKKTIKNKRKEMTNNMSDFKAKRLCHVIKRDDFDGYGFNLHAEKGKPGQYIGKVDDNSPAEASGLRQGDRIIEVNGVNIGNETHKQVVQRIKAIANEVRLLVVDPTLVSVSNNNRVIDGIANDTAAQPASPATISNESSNNKSMANASSHSNDSTDAAAAAAIKTKPMTNGNGNNDSNGNSPPPPPPSVTNHKSNQSSQMNLSSSSSTMSSPEKQQLATATNNANQTTTTHPSGTTASEGLNLKMTVAELRAKLAAKKKYDPKNDSVDLRKKYEIVQKLWTQKIQEKNWINTI